MSQSMARFAVLFFATSSLSKPVQVTSYLVHLEAEDRGKGRILRNETLSRSDCRLAGTTSLGNISNRAVSSQR